MKVPDSIGPVATAIQRWFGADANWVQTATFSTTNRWYTCPLAHAEQGFDHCEFWAAFAYDEHEVTSVLYQLDKEIERRVDRVHDPREVEFLVLSVLGP